MNYGSQLYEKNVFFFVSVTEEERGREKEFAWATKRKEKRRGRKKEEKGFD